MAKGIFTHRADSPYDDFPEEHYQFPQRYLNRARDYVGDWIIYYEPRRGGGRMGYCAIAQVDRIDPDPRLEDMFVAHMVPGSYLPLEVFVPSHEGGVYRESALNHPDGGLNRGLMQWAIRPISESDFAAIVDYGLPEISKFPPRERIEDTLSAEFGFVDAGAPFLFERERVLDKFSRVRRDVVFRKVVLDAYESRCAFTGLRLINGGGAAEVQAAHIKPVEARGPDTVRNGLALSATVHWMFDRGLLSLSDDLDILVSRQVNDREQVLRLVNFNLKAFSPANDNLRPHPVFLAWHRENRFKA